MHKLLTHGVGRELREWTAASLTGIRQWRLLSTGDVGMQICCNSGARGARTRGLSRSIAVGGGALAFFGRRRRRAEAPPSAVAASRLTGVAARR